MSEKHIVTKRTDKRLLVTLNRPQKSNAMSAAMLHELMQILDDANADESIHALLITGAGERTFCGGADLSEPDTMANEALWEEVTAKIESLPIFTVALINGACIGGGLVLALSCDIRIGVPHANFAYPVLRNRLLPGRDATRRLKSLIGPGHSNMILLGAQRINAEDAALWGLLDRQVSTAELHETGAKLCEAACEVEREHVGDMKRRCYQSGYSGFD